MSETMQYRGFDGSVVFDADDNLFHGRLLGIKDFVLYDADNVEQLEQHFRSAVDEFLLWCSSEGRTPAEPYESSPIRLPLELHREAAVLAEERELGVDALVAKAVSQYLDREKQAA